MPLIIMCICFGLFCGFLFIPAILDLFKPKKGIVITPDKDTEVKIKYIRGRK